MLFPLFSQFFLPLFMNAASGASICLVLVMFQGMVSFVYRVCPCGNDDDCHDYVLYDSHRDVFSVKNERAGIQGLPFLDINSFWR